MFISLIYYIFAAIVRCEPGNGYYFYGKQIWK